jgi:lipopolysaccharide transport system ATP-binding protein
MSSSEFSIRVEGLSKRFEIYAQPIDRLKQMTLPRFQRAMRRPTRSYFKEFWALRDVSFDVLRGETVGIVGRNGSGKSTLLQMICGTLHPTSGRIFLGGRIAALLELGAGFNPEFTGRENVYLNAAVIGLHRDEIDARFGDIAAFADIGDFMEQPVKTYSSGMYVRLAFAVAINVDPEILVVDEALSVGDEAFQRKCFGRLNQIRQNGATILFVSHSAGAVIELCDHAILLDGGELLARGTPKFIVSRYHKMLYAPSSKATSIRERIRLEGSSHMDAKGEPEPFESALVPKARTAITDEAYLDEGLVPQSTVRYEQRGAAIEHPHIETLEGVRVNVLRTGGEYIYTYRVKFTSTAVGVRFGMLIKTITGLELGGAATAPNNKSDLIVIPGQEFVVRFRFRALLAPGVYFLNAGVVASNPDGDIYLDRLTDAVMLRIMPDEDRLATGIVDFHVEPEFELEAEVLT